jgi:prepilin-type processing-associated H-X9-DG protein
MSHFMNDIPNPAADSCWHKYSAIRAPPPAKAFVFIDEHENSIDNSRFVCSQRGTWMWIDFPATRHQNACVLSFADGHAELWKWREANTIAAGKLPPWIQGVAARSGDRDLGRLQESIPVVPIR